MIVILVAISLLFSVQLRSQEGRSEREYVEFISKAKAAGITSFVSLKSGCWGCEVVYKLDEKKIAINNAKEITLIYQVEKSCKKIIFYDYDKSFEESDIDDCSIFDYILSSKKELMRKETFYKKNRKKPKFMRPVSTHYSYEEIGIDTKEIQYSLYMVNESANGELVDRTGEKWYQISIKIANSLKIRS